jgi:hypothetical protein
MSTGKIIKKRTRGRKEGINLVMGQWKIIEHHNEQSNEYWHSPFLEQTPVFEQHFEEQELL